MNTHQISKILKKLIEKYDNQIISISSNYIINNGNINGEDAENFILNICDELNIDYEKFNKKIPFDTIFPPSLNIAFLPLIPFFLLKNKFKIKKQIKLISIQDFSKLIYVNFFKDKK